MKIYQRYVGYREGYATMRLTKLLHKLGAGKCLFDFTLVRREHRNSDEYFMELTIK